MNQLINLKKFSTIVVDSGDVELINHYKPQHATTNPSLILKSPILTTYRNLFEDALIYAKKKGGNQHTRVHNASDKLTVNIGSKILEIIPGHVSTEIDANISFDSGLIIKKARKLIKMYHEQGVDTQSRVLIKIAATWEGIKAAEILEKDGIKCNLTLLFSFAQAQACAEANVYLISPFIGRIYDWYYNNKLLEKNNINNDPGIIAAKRIYYYYKEHDYKTIIMGASFRTTEQILALSGCDCLTISPNLLKKLTTNNQPIKRNLHPIKNKIINKPNPLSESTFLLKHNQNKMATEKLIEGIKLFSLDQKKLNNILIKNI